MFRANTCSSSGAELY